MISNASRDISSSIPFQNQKLVGWKKFIYRGIATEISRLTRYYDQLIQYLPRTDDSGFLLSKIDCREKHICKTWQEFPNLTDEISRRSAILLNGNLNYHLDIQGLLSQLKIRLSRTSRVIAIVYNPYLSFVYRLANFLKIRKAELPTTFLTRSDLQNICKLAGYEIVRKRPTIFFPLNLFGIGLGINYLLSFLPGFRLASLTEVVTIRPCIAETAGRYPSLSIIIPTRNERGNIENAIKRMPRLCDSMEIIFIEGHSQDNTWEEIQRVIPLYEKQFKIKAFQQSGKGKGDAVRLGFSKATGDVLTILDADLTMPPEMLGQFYDAYRLGLADFVNGSRLAYPMEGQAMRFLNRLGNVFFAKALSYVLDVTLADSLCGTKLFAKHDYERMIEWRKCFGDFDPFGDFEMIFPAAILGLGVINVPIRYAARTYGSTNISRFRHGWMLLKMTCVGWLRVSGSSPFSGNTHVADT